MCRERHRYLLHGIGEQSCRDAERTAESLHVVYRLRRCNGSNGRRETIRGSERSERAGKRHGRQPTWIESESSKLSRWVLTIPCLQSNLNTSWESSVFTCILHCKGPGETTTKDRRKQKGPRKSAWQSLAAIAFAAHRHDGLVYLR